MKEVDLAAFLEFIAAYPRSLDRDVSAMFDPPVLRFFDWSLAPTGAADALERCQVAWCFVDDGREPEHGWHILNAVPLPSTEGPLPPEPRPEPAPVGATTYDPRDVRVFFRGQEIIGLAPDSVIEIDPEPERNR